MKKLVLFSLLGLGVLTGCFSSGKTEKKNPFQSKEEINVISTLSVSSVVTADQYNLAPRSVNLTRKMSSKTPTQTTIDEAAKVYESTKALFEKDIQSESLESDLENYISLQQITYDGQIYKLYVASSTEKKDDEEWKMHYNGMIVSENTEYQYEAIMEIETEEDETEQENQFKIYIDENTYVSIETKKEVEANEQEMSYQYSVVKDSKVVDSFNAKLEIENNETEVKVTTLIEQFKFKSILYQDTLYIRVKDGINCYTLESKDGSYQLSQIDFDAIEDLVCKNDDNLNS